MVGTRDLQLNSESEPQGGPRISHILIGYVRFRTQDLCTEGHNTRSNEGVVNMLFSYASFFIRFRLFRDALSTA
jgi:hypothetical protein